MNPSTSLLQDLQSLLGEHGVTTDAALLAAHASDWSEAPRQTPPLLLCPRTPQQVADVLALCSKHQARVVVQGGLTGLAGGATPQAGEVALSLAKLNAIEAIDTMGGTATVQAGVVLEELQRRVETVGWTFPLDLGARGSCQVGGNAATNAGGNRVIRYGTMRELIHGLEVALPDGRLLTMMNSVTKNVTGIDLKQLFIGSEGTLGVITRLVLKLSPQPAAATTAMCALPDFEAATRLLKDLRRALPGLSAFELMWDDFMTAALDVASLRAPFAEAAPVYALLEVQGASEAQDRAQLEELLGEAMEAGTVSDAVVAQSLAEAQRLWAYRESIGEMLGRTRPHAAFDVGVPMALMDGFVRSVRTALTARFPSQRHVFFGHLGDGNLHLLSGPHETPEALLAVEALVYEAVGRAGGSVSAEHGIGVLKQAFLGHSRSEAEIELMQSLKALLDPAGILNAGRVYQPVDSGHAAHTSVVTP